METDFGTQVRIAREKRGWSQDELAARAGTTQSTVDRIEKGVVTYSRAAPSIANALGLPFTLKTGVAGPAITIPVEAGARHSITPAQDLPVFSAAEGGPGVMLIEKSPVDYISRPSVMANAPNAYAVYVVGESMIPEFWPGEIALVNPHIPPVSHEPCVFYTFNGADDRAAIKRLLRKTAESWLVEQWNPAKQFELSREEWPKCLE